MRFHERQRSEITVVPTVTERAQAEAFLEESGVFVLATAYAQSRGGVVKQRNNTDKDSSCTLRIDVIWDEKERTGRNTDKAPERIIEDYGRFFIITCSRTGYIGFRGAQSRITISPQQWRDDQSACRTALNTVSADPLPYYTVVMGNDETIEPFDPA